MIRVGPLFLLVGGLLLTSPVDACGQRLTLEIRAAEPPFEEAAAEYRSIWAQEGTRMVRALERVSGLSFSVDVIDVTVMEAPSWAGRDRMGMRASYTPDTKRATLVHELGHILIGDVVPEDEDGTPVEDHHRVLFLFLYDVWIELWGMEFANAQVAVESERRGIVDYEGIWRGVLRFDAAARAAELAGLLERWSG